MGMFQLMHSHFIFLDSVIVRLDPDLAHVEEEAYKTKEGE